MAGRSAASTCWFPSPGTNERTVEIREAGSSYMKLHILPDNRSKCHGARDRGQGTVKLQESRRVWLSDGNVTPSPIRDTPVRRQRVKTVRWRSKKRSSTGRQLPFELSKENFNWPADFLRRIRVRRNQRSVLCALTRLLHDWVER